MIKKKSTYSFVHTSRSLKALTAFSFFLLMIIKPVVNMTTIFIDENYEQVDTFDKGNSEEKGDVLELDDQLLSRFTTSTIISLSNKRLSYKDAEKNSSNYCFEIQLPPPEYT